MKPWLRWLILVAGYPLVMWLVWIWLGVAERDPGDLILSVVLGVAIVAGLTGLVWIVFGGSLPRSLGFVLSILLLTMLMSLLPSSGPKLRSIYPWAVRAGTLVLMAILLALVLLGTTTMFRRWQYWLAWCALAVGVYAIPSWLVGWVPQLTSMTAQTTSMVVRFGLAYLIALGTLTAFARYVRQMANPQPGR